MTDQLKSARDILFSEGYTCVLVKGDIICHSRERGIKPLLMLLDSGTDVRGFSAADKVVGKATAFLYCLLGVREIYAPVISRAAKEVLIRHGISASYDQQVEGILNHRRTGSCPMEAAVRGIDDAEEALDAIRDALQTLS